MRSFSKGQQTVLLAVALTALLVNLKRPLHTPVAPHALCQRQAQLQWPVEITGTLEEIQTGTRMRAMRRPDDSWRIIFSPMDTKKMLVLGIPFNVNDARPQDLALVPGISEALAQRIVGFRDAKGPFKTWDDLRKVKGVGPAKIETFREYFRVSGNTH